MEKSYQNTLIQLIFSFEILVLPIVTQNFLPNTVLNLKNEISFKTEPKDVSVLQNSSVILPCSITAGNYQHVQWTKDGFGLGTDRKLKEWKQFRIVGKDQITDWDLEIDPISVDDDDVYQCQVTLGYTSSLRSRKAKVEVLVPPQDPFIKEGRVLTVKESRDVTITCISKGGKPAAKLTWYDEQNNIIGDVGSYNTKKMEGTKLFEAISTLTITPTRELHNATFRCEATNEADNLSIERNMLEVDIKEIRPAAEVRLFVQYAPSVSVHSVRPGMVEEGNKVSFRCDAVANPPPYPNSFQWYIDDKKVRGHFQQYFEIYNITRQHHDKQIKCSVENELGTAMGLRSIEVKYGPKMIMHPKTTSGDKMSAVMLYCVVESNPPPKYYWTKGNSREVISRHQNYTVPVSEDTIGTYYCHAEVSGYKTITSRPGADVLMTGPPQITSSTKQSGVVGENVHINCAAITVPQPEADGIIWMYHESKISEGNSHYRIINSPIQHGIRSTLVIRESLITDFGPYTCSITNNHGTRDMQIELEQQRPFPLQMILIAVFGGVIFILLLSIVCILFRKRLCCCCFDSEDINENKILKSKRKDADANNLKKVNNIVDQLAGGATQLKKENMSPMPQDNDSAVWGSSEVDHDGGFISGTLCRSSTIGGENQAINQLCGSGELIPPNSEFQPQPDVINGGYVSYGHVMDYNPPSGVANRNTIYEYTANPNMMSSPGTVLNVSDPRYSATYGNPYLKQLPDPSSQRNLPYSTFQPTSLASGAIQSPTSIANNSLVINAAPNQIQSNRLSYVGASNNSPHPAPNINLLMPNNGPHVVYGTLNNASITNTAPNGNISQPHGTQGIETVRPTALVSSYISSLNNAREKQSYTPNSSFSNMSCLPEEIELGTYSNHQNGLLEPTYLSPQISCAENYKTSTPVRTSSSEGYGTLKRPVNKNNPNSVQKQWRKKVAPISKTTSLPPARIDSSDSSITSHASHIGKGNQRQAHNLDESMRNGSSSIIGIGPGQSLQHGDYCSTNKYGGSLNRPQNNINQAPKVISSFNEPSTNTLPLNRINNAHQKNIHQIEPPVSLGTGGNVQNSTLNSSFNHSLSQTPPPPPMPPIQHLATSKANLSGMGTHV